MLKQYIEQYKRGFEFRFLERITQELCGIHITVDVWLYLDLTKYERRQKAVVTMEKNGLTYQCECVDVHGWNRMFHPVTIDGKRCLCFRKTLYGFTFLNVDTLTEEYDYFPTGVLNGEDSFIIVEATMFEDLMIFSGCYWAWPYWSVAYDPKSRCFLNLCDAYGVWDDTVTVETGTLILNGKDGDEKAVTATVSYDDLKCRLAEHGTADFVEPQM